MAATARKQRLGIFGGVLVLAIVVVVAIVLAVGGGSSKKAHVDTSASATTPGNSSSSSSNGVLVDSGANDQFEVGLQSGTNLSLIDNQIHATIGGIEQHGNTLGNPKAKVKALYFGDLQCSWCQMFTIFDLPAFVSAYVRTGKASLTYHSLQTATSSSTVFQNQQVAAYAAGLQNKAWDFIERFYRQQGAEGSGYSTVSYWNAIAKQISGLNFSTWSSDRVKDPNLVSQLQTDATLGQKYGATGTPTVVFVGPKGTKVASLSLPDPDGSVKSAQATTAPSLQALTAAYNAVL